MKKSILLYILAFPILVVLVFVVMDSVLGLNNVDNLRNDIKNYVETDKDDRQNETGPLNVAVESLEITTYEPITNVLVMSNKEITVLQTNRLNLILADQEEDTYYYVLEIGNIGVGESSVIATFVDSIEQEEKVTFTVTREIVSLPFGLEFIQSWPNTTYIVDGSDLLADVNKSRRLLATYVPEDLVDLNIDYLLYTNSKGVMLQREAADYLKIMLTDMQEQIGRNVVVASAYRSYNEQVETYASWLRGSGQIEADTYSARPGYSEHQLGRVVDFINEESGFDFTEAFGDTDAGKWLVQNSYKYGFVPSLARESAEMVGYIFEPWHFRYIGVDNAKKFMESGEVFAEWIQNQ